MQIPATDVQILSILLLAKAIAQQQAECSISSACTPALGPGGDVLCLNESLGTAR